VSHYRIILVNSVTDYSQKFNYSGIIGSSLFKSLVKYAALANLDSLTWDWLVPLLSDIQLNLGKLSFYSVYLSLLVLLNA